MPEEYVDSIIRYNVKVDEEYKILPDKVDQVGIAQQMHVQRIKDGEPLLMKYKPDKKLEEIER